jgi:hypothetical protein
MNEQQEARLHEIMTIAMKLEWFSENPNGYPLMQGSEVEKCILMAMDNRELERFRNAAGKPLTPRRWLRDLHQCNRKHLLHLQTPIALPIIKRVEPRYNLTNLRGSDNIVLHLRINAASHHCSINRT